MQYWVLLYLGFHYVSCSDPCTNFHYLYDDGGRSSQCGAGSDRCDRYLTTRWYKVIIEEGPLQMPTTPVPLNSCSTVYPLWMNGTYPDVSDGEVERNACVTTPSSTCEFTHTIKVMNCNTFYVFYLVRTDGCPERYCFGANACPTTTTPPTTTTTELTTIVQRSTSDVNVTDKEPMAEKDQGLIGIGVGIGIGLAVAVFLVIISFIIMGIVKQRKNSADDMMSRKLIGPVIRRRNLASPVEGKRNSICPVKEKRSESATQTQMHCYEKDHTLHVEDYTSQHLATFSAVEVDMIMQTLTGRRVQQWAQSINKLLLDAAGRKEFQMFRKGRKSVSSSTMEGNDIHFFMLCQELKYCSKGDVAGLNKKIFKDYIDTSSIHLIPLNAETKQSVQDKLKEDPSNRSLFPDTMADIVGEMETDYAAFLCSEQYKILPVDSIHSGQRKRKGVQNAATVHVKWNAESGMSNGVTTQAIPALQKADSGTQTELLIHDDFPFHINSTSGRSVQPMYAKMGTQPRTSWLCCV